MVSYKTQAISIRTAPFAEADKLVTLFTRERGKIRAIAKGARRIPSRLSGRVETLTYGDYFIVDGRSLDIISQCQVIESFQSVRESPRGLPASLYVLKLVDLGTMDGEIYPELFELLRDALYQIKRGNDCRWVVKNFEMEFARVEGVYREGADPGKILSEHLGDDLEKWNINIA